MYRSYLRITRATYWHSTLKAMRATSVDLTHRSGFMRLCVINFIRRAGNVRRASVSICSTVKNSYLTERCNTSMFVIIAACVGMLDDRVCDRLQQAL
jgi:hypothetical protein